MLVQSSIVAGLEAGAVAVEEVEWKTVAKQFKFVVESQTDRYHHKRRLETDGVCFSMIHVLPSMLRGRMLSAFTHTTAAMLTEKE